MRNGKKEEDKQEEMHSVEERRAGLIGYVFLCGNSSRESPRI